MAEPIRLPVLAEVPEGPAPEVRGDCLPGGINEVRPCRWITCRYHLSHSEKASCALDVADEGGLTLEEVGELMGVTRERIRQIEEIALRKVRKSFPDLRSNRIH